MKLNQLFIAALLLIPVTSNAAIMSLDFSGAGDGLITRDLDHNLDWLDVSATVGISSNNAVATYASSGFRLATDDELVSLYIGAGVDQVLDFNYGVSTTAVVGTNTAYQNVTSVGGIAALNDLYASLGGGVGNFGGNLWIHGYLADHDSDGLSALGRLGVWSAVAGSAHINTNGDGWNPNGTHTQVGSFLVREANVPEPSTLVLFGLGLLGLSLSRKKAK